MKKLLGLFARAKSSTVIVAVLAVMAGTQLAVFAKVYDPFGDGFGNIGPKCEKSSDPQGCIWNECAKYSIKDQPDHPDPCGYQACINGAIKFHNYQTAITDSQEIDFLPCKRDRLNQNPSL